MPAIMIVSFVMMYICRIAKLVIFSRLPRCTKKTFLVEGPREDTARWFKNLYGVVIDKNHDTLAGLLSGLKEISEPLSLRIARLIRTKKVFYTGRNIFGSITIWLLPDGSLFQEETVGEKIYPAYAYWSMQGKFYLVNVSD